MLEKLCDSQIFKRFSEVGETLKRCWCIVPSKNQGIQMGFKDKLYPDYHCETVEIIKDVERYEILGEPNLEPIIIALREGPKTVNELEKDYNEIVEDKIKKMNLSSKETAFLKDKMKRQAKTLYKYLKKLKENGFVVEAGKRYTDNQKAAEILYGRTAKIFFNIDGKEHWIETEIGKASLKMLSKLIGIINKGPKPSIRGLKESFMSIENKVRQDMEDIFTTYSTEIEELSDDITYEDLKFLIGGLNIFLLMKNYPNFEEDLKRSKII